MKRYLMIMACLILATASSGHAADQVKFKFLSEATVDAKGAPLIHPEGVVCTTNSSVVVADTGNARLVRYTLVNDELKDGAELKFQQVPYPIRARANSKGELFVLDGKIRTIFRIGADGTLIGSLDPASIPPPANFEPRSMAIDRSDTIYILDVYGERILVLDPTGKYQRQVPLPKGDGFFSDLNVDSRGNMFLVDSLNGQVFKAAKDAPAFQVIAKGLEAYLYFGVNIETDKQGRIFLLDQNEGAVILLGQDGSFQGRYLTIGWKKGQLYYPSQGCMTEDGKFVVADRNNNRVQLFQVQ